MSRRPAYDQIIQGLSGVMSITGKPRTTPSGRIPPADTIGGLTAAMAISAALNKAPRGQFIDVSMLDSVLTTMDGSCQITLSAASSRQSTAMRM